jgi:hypothetical protein
LEESMSMEFELLAPAIVAVGEALLKARSADGHGVLHRLHRIALEGALATLQRPVEEEKPKKVLSIFGHQAKCHTCGNQIYHDGFYTLRCLKCAQKEPVDPEKVREAMVEAKHVMWRVQRGMALDESGGALEPIIRLLTEALGEEK